jgi:hypothetical protein
LRTAGRLHHAVGEVFVMLRRSVFAFVCMSLLAGAAQAAPINLLTNGSFEAGLTGWTIGGGGAFPVSVVTTNTPCCFGEFVPNDTFNLGTTDLTGNHGVYFVDDFAHQTLTQSIALAPGTYEIGFDAYVPLNGFNNPVDAAFSGTIAGVTLARFTVKSQQPQTWMHFAGVANVLGGVYNVSFDYQPFQGIAGDVVIDRVYIAQSDRNDGTPIDVPEPATMALVGLGLAAGGVRTLRSKIRRG